MASLWSGKVLNSIQSGREIFHSYQSTQSCIQVLGNGSVYIKADMDADKLLSI